MGGLISQKEMVYFLYVYRMYLLMFEATSRKKRVFVVF